MTASTVRKKGIRDVFEILHHSRYFLEFKYFPIIYELEKLVFLEEMKQGVGTGYSNIATKSTEIMDYISSAAVRVLH